MTKVWRFEQPSHWKLDLLPKAGHRKNMSEEKTTENIVIMVAAGRGQRAGGGVPKQYRKLRSFPVLTHSLRAFLDCPEIDAIQCVIHPDDRPLFQNAVACLTEREQAKIRKPVLGGETRQQSVLAGLEALASEKSTADLVLVHDAARPFVTPALIRRGLAAAKIHGAAIPALPVTDTLKQVDQSGLVTATPDRSKLMGVQTPQVFSFALLLEAHRAARVVEGLTDDAMVVERSGHPVHIYRGETDNIKLTTEDDFIRAERVMGPNMLTLTGFGYDVHAFTAGDHVTLAGVKIPHEKGIRAHSDGDVILHALCDALFGVMGDGDIGQHFPPSDPQWKGTSSDHFVRFALERLEMRKGRLLHVDISLVAEAPRIGPYRAQMIANLADMLSLAQTRIGLKATTSESMGFTGRKEGLAAAVTVTVNLPEQE